ncbi:MAG: tripartite tricarboxylate transporter substrate binding protein, partial [Burkholderiales bacterium]
MMKRMMGVLSGVLVLTGTGLAPAWSQSYPARPIRIVIPYPPGGTSDILARLIGAKLTDAWKQQVIVDNR